jgi:hypothetical protein
MAGILFIIATASSILSLPFLTSINATDYLTSVSANGSLFATGVLLSFVAAFSSASIAISMYPVLKRYSDGLALGAIGFRLIEGVFYIVSAVGLLLLFTLSQQFVNAGSPASGDFQTLGALLLAGYRWSGNVGSLIAFSLGAMMYYYLFYRTRLVPRWLAAWGFLGVAMTLAAAILVMYSLIGPLSTSQVILALPIAVQEMVLAVWLIVKGFNPSAIP